MKIGYGRVSRLDQNPDCAHYSAETLTTALIGGGQCARRHRQDGRTRPALAAEHLADR